MKHLFSTLILAVLVTTLSFAQSQTVDILYLKNGSIIRGQVIQLDTENVKIKTADGSIFVYKFSEVEKMEKENTEIKPASTPTPLPEPTIVQTETPDSSDYILESDEIRFGMRAGLYGGLQIWDQLEGDPDSKLGFGLNMMFILGAQIDRDTYAGLGPQFGGSFWTLSTNISGYEASATTNVLDYGINLFFEFDDLFMILGVGSADVSITATAGGSSETVEMPESASYRRIGLGFSSDFGIMISYVSYSDWASNLGRFEINFGWTPKL